VRWLIPVGLLLLWLIVGSVAGPASGKLSQVQKNDASSFLPASAESTKVSDLAKKFTDRQTFPAFVLLESDRRLSTEQLRSFAAFTRTIPSIEIPVTGAPSVKVGDYLAPGPVVVIPAKDGKAALALVNFGVVDFGKTLADGKSPLQRAVEEIRAKDATLATDGARIYVSGPAGLIADLVKAFGGIDGVLLGVALITVLVILLIVYRSPVVPLIVLSSAGFAYAAASGMVYLLAKNEVITLDGQGQGILSILVIGAATDYALLLVARYREELRRHDDRYEAMWLAWRRALEPIAASGSTVIIGLLCLLFSNLGPTKGLGPVGAVGIAAAMLSALTFLPAILLAPGLFVGLIVTAGVGAAAGLGAHSAAGLDSGPAVEVGAGVAVAVALALGLVERAVGRRRERRRQEHGEAVEAGRWLFWPGVPHVGTVGPEATGLWARVARGVGAKPRRAWVGSVAVLLLLASWLPTLNARGTTQADTFLTTVESVTGDKVLAAHFPGGSGSPTIVVGPADRSDALVSAVRKTSGVASVVPTAEESKQPKVVDGMVELQVTLTDPADSPAADDTVRRLRTDLDAVSPDALVGGTTASNLDVRDISSADRNRIIPIVLLVIFVVLALLLRALVAPLILLLANVLSFAATLGASALVFNHVFDFPGSDPSVPLYGFVFLVALGIDYSIFLMTRVREESLRQGTRPGILTGLAVTGGVITSAGVVLAATFAALGVLPILFLAQIAFIVAFGVLLDTLVVRSLLVPALSYEIGKRIWLPGRLGRAEREEPAHGEYHEDVEPVSAGR
jgi:RND superfamily putative drug exporter